MAIFGVHILPTTLTIPLTTKLKVVSQAYKTRHNWKSCCLSDFTPHHSLPVQWNPTGFLAILQKSQACSTRCNFSLGSSPSNGHIAHSLTWSTSLCKCNLKKGLPWPAVWHRPQPHTHTRYTPSLSVLYPILFFFIASDIVYIYLVIYSLWNPPFQMQAPWEWGPCFCSKPELNAWTVPGTQEALNTYLVNRWMKAE